MQYFHHSDTAVAIRVRPHPDRLAAKSGDHTVTYGEFNQLANRIAWAILEKRPARQLGRLP
jgi:non-ribosomal peptide synthetase component F